MTDILGRFSFIARPNKTGSTPPLLLIFARIAARRANLAPVVSFDWVFLISKTDESSETCSKLKLALKQKCTYHSCQL